MLAERWGRWIPERKGAVQMRHEAQAVTGLRARTRARESVSSRHPMQEGVVVHRAASSSMGRVEEGALTPKTEAMTRRG